MRHVIVVRSPSRAKPRASAKVTTIMANQSLATNSTNNQALLDWVEEMAKLCQPDRVSWCDGSEQEYQHLCELMVQSGTLTKLNAQKRPGCFLARSHPSDVA